MDSDDMQHSMMAPNKLFLRWGVQVHWICFLETLACKAQRCVCGAWTKKEKKRRRNLYDTRVF
jgi:hypothetical protein